MKKVTVKSSVNIAVIKYWGKKDEELVIPLNNSISSTLSLNDLCSTTTVAASSSFVEDRFWLNGEEISIKKNQRLSQCLEHVRNLRPDIKEKLHICSVNNFPTAAGLASSAAGYSCLIFALGIIFNIDDIVQLSRLARMGSGSACRSLFGGFVQWIAGYDSQTSYAHQIVDENYWPDMRVMILVVNERKKDTTSTDGMKRSKETSSLIHCRVNEVVPLRCKQMIKAIKNRDFNSFAELAMKDSNSFHAICQDTFPPIRYMNDISWSIVRLVHAYNQFYKTNQVAYTFDAGPNACLYLLKEKVEEVYSIINYFYPSTLKNENYFRGEFIAEKKINPTILKVLQENDFQVQKNCIKSIIFTKIGSSPKVDEYSNLLNDQGLPK